MADTGRGTKPILVVDFDGVIHSYTSGWVQPDFIPDPPVEGALEWLAEMSKHFNLQIYSSRSNQDGGIRSMQIWLEYWAKKILPNDEPDYQRNGLINRVCWDKDAWPTTKPPALVTLDDRVICFQGPGTWPTAEELKNFKPWNKK